MSRQQIEADLKGLRMMWISGWRWQVFNAWIDAFDHYPVTEWWQERPWKTRGYNVGQ